MKNKIPLLMDRFMPSFRLFFWNHLHIGAKAYMLCFHDVSESEDNFAIHREDYYSIILRIKEKIVRIDDIRNSGIVISFDDGYASLYDTVLPFMEAQELPFVCYITTGFLDTPGYLTKQQLIELSKSKWCTIGSHMCTHSRTRELSKDRIENEWAESKRLLEKITMKSVLHAALPYGSYNACTFKSKKIALKVGYKTVADTIAVPFAPKSRIISRFVYQKNNSRVAELIETLK